MYFNNVESSLFFPNNAHSILPPESPSLLRHFSLLPYITRLLFHTGVFLPDPVPEENGAPMRANLPADSPPSSALLKQSLYLHVSHYSSGRYVFCP